jgi:hypothetical protein
MSSDGPAHDVDTVMAPRTHMPDRMLAPAVFGLVLGYGGDEGERLMKRWLTMVFAWTLLVLAPSPAPAPTLDEYQEQYRQKQTERHTERERQDAAAAREKTLQTGPGGTADDALDKLDQDEKDLDERDQIDDERLDDDLPQD